MRQTFHPHLILLRRRGLRHVKPAISGLQFGLKWLLRIVCSPHRLTYVFKQLVIQSCIRFSFFLVMPVTALIGMNVCHICVCFKQQSSPQQQTSTRPVSGNSWECFNHGPEKTRERNAGRRLVERWRMKGNKRLTVATWNMAFSLTSSLSVQLSSFKCYIFLCSLKSHILNTPTDPFYVLSFLSLSSFCFQRIFVATQAVELILRHIVQRQKSLIV